MLHKTGVRMRAHICGLVGGLVLVMSSHQLQASEIAAVGPLEAVDCQAGSAQVLGITFRTSDVTARQAICSADFPFEISYVAVSGLADTETVQLKKFSILSKGQYVPGATPVYIRGGVTQIRPAFGEVVLSGATIQGVYGDLDSTEVEILGTQPILGGVILAETISPISLSTSRGSRSLDSSTGSGKLSSTGSGKLSSTGSGTLSSTGSGILSSTGSGTLSSTGSGKLSSTGSGKLSSTGSGVLSSTGLGTLSSTGSGKLSSTGSGVLSSTGSGTLSSTRSGKLSSTGSGVLSSTGSGVLSSTGSGILSSTGSGVLSSTGSGALSSTGSGTLSSTGSGTLSSTGSGIQLD